MEVSSIDDSSKQGDLTNIDENENDDVAVGDNSISKQRDLTNIEENENDCLVEDNGAEDVAPVSSENPLGKFTSDDPIVQQYIKLSLLSDYVINTNSFSNYILLCIVIAGILAGMQQYPSLEFDPTVLLIDFIVLVSFVIEVILKICAEGIQPSLYFFGEDRRLEAWNMFDFSLVVISLLPFSPKVKFLRLIRLMRLAKVFRRVKQLQMIMEGLVGGLNSTIYVVLLMALVFYIYAIMGIFIFRANDPWHFHSIEITMITLLRIAAFDNWGELFYINYYGCSEFPSTYYTNDISLDSGKLGGLKYCASSQAMPVLASIYFLSFCFLATFCIFSLFIGTITMSMWDSLTRMKMAEILEENSGDVGLKKEQLDDIKKRVFKPQRMNRKARESLKHIRLAFGGNVMHLHQKPEDRSKLDPMLYYNILSIKCAKIVEALWFQNLVIICIIMAAINVSLEMDKGSEDREGFTSVISFLVQVVFVAECLCKIIAEGEFPTMYFNDPWNVFDFLMAVVGFLPGSFEMFRILRLFRVFKMLKMFPRLQILLSALNAGLSSIGFIGLILGLYFFIFGLIGNILFGNNDRTGFGTLHRSVLTLFQCITLDNWSNYLYTNLYGCDAFDEYDGICPSTNPQFILSFLYFVSLVIIGTLVLLSLFIGVISMSMEEAAEEHRENEEINNKVKAIMHRCSLDTPISFYYQVFRKIDFSHRKRIGKAELQFGMNIAGLELSMTEFEFVWGRVDKNHSGCLDFSEFLEFMIDLRRRKKGTVNMDGNSPPPGGAAGNGSAKPETIVRKKRILSYFRYNVTAEQSENDKIVARAGSVSEDYKTSLSAFDVLHSVKSMKNKNKKHKVVVPVTANAGNTDDGFLSLDKVADDTEAEDNNSDILPGNSAFGKLNKYVQQVKSSEVEGSASVSQFVEEEEHEGSSHIAGRSAKSSHGGSSKQASAFVDEEVDDEEAGRCVAAMAACLAEEAKSRAGSRPPSRNQSHTSSNMKTAAKDALLLAIVEPRPLQKKDGASSEIS